MKTRILVFLNAIIAVSGQLLYSQGSQYLTGDVIRITSSDTLQRQLIAAGEWIEIAGTISKEIDRENLGVIPERLTIDVQQRPYFTVIMFQVWYYLGLLVIKYRQKGLTHA
jgi:hypothetical protein